ncbi:MAG TPA: glutamate racemase [Candidatus Obscuribacterales bacterium]
MIKSKVTTIGLFDSGVGGLSVLRRLQQLACAGTGDAGLRFIYLADTARCPYGGRDPREISQFVREIVGWLVGQGAQEIVMACNTSAALAAGVARASSRVPVRDLIEPTARYAACLDTGIAVLATENTVRSRAFSRAILEQNPAARVTEIACPELVPLVERGALNETETRQVLDRYLRQLKDKGVGAVILGCTHYPFLSATLADVLASDVLIIDPADCLLADMSGYEGNGNGNGNRRNPAESASQCDPAVFVTGSPSEFARIGEICLGRRVGTICGITLGDLSGVQSAGALAAQPADLSPRPALSDFLPAPG